jgi:hypothetical protein
VSDATATLFELVSCCEHANCLVVDTNKVRFKSLKATVKPANGTRLNTGCSLSSLRIGAVSRFAIMRRSTI